MYGVGDENNNNDDDDDECGGGGGGNIKMAHFNVWRTEASYFHFPLSFAFYSDYDLI